jgi:hypothetical protein
MTLAFSDDSHSDDHSDTGHGRVDATAGRVRHSDSSAQAPSSVRMDAYSQVGAAREGNWSALAHDTTQGAFLPLAGRLAADMCVP